jgi:hypothetical protein
VTKYYLLSKTRDTKRKVELVSSQDEYDEEGFGLLSDEEPTGLSIPHSSTKSAPTLPFKLRPGENLENEEDISVSVLCHPRLTPQKIIFFNRVIKLSLNYV